MRAPLTRPSLRVPTAPAITRAGAVQGGLPEVGPLPEPGKRFACISAKVTPETRDGLRDEAARLGVTTSALLDSMARRRSGAGRANGQSGLRDRLSPAERAARTVELIEALAGLWLGAGARRRA